VMMENACVKMEKNASAKTENVLVTR
jgi:hypothetical protein